MHARSGVPARVREPGLDEGPFAAAGVVGRPEGHQLGGDADRGPAEDADEAVVSKPFALGRAEGLAQARGRIGPLTEMTEAGSLSGRDEELPASLSRLCLRGRVEAAQQEQRQRQDEEGKRESLA